MVAVPTPTPTTLPLEFTVATDVSLLSHVTDLLAAFAGRTVTVKVSFAPISMLVVALLRVQESGLTKKTPQLLNPNLLQRD